MFATIRQLQELYHKYGQDYSTSYPYGDFDGENSGYDFYGVSFPLRLCCSRWDGSDVRRGARTTEGARGGGDESALQRSNGRPGATPGAIPAPLLCGRSAHGRASSCWRVRALFAAACGEEVLEKAVVKGTVGRQLPSRHCAALPADADHRGASRGV